MTLDLPSDLEVLPVVVRAAELFCERVVGRPALAERLKLSLVEAVENAVRHANRGDHSRRVRVTLRWHAPEAVAEVEDEGPPFDLPETDPDPAEAREGGRGLYLMRRLADRLEMERTERGNLVRLAWRLA